MFNLIKEYLKRWGQTPHGEPRVRLIWSEDAKELRYGEFNEFYGSLFLREFIGVKLCPKYSWIKERYVLERWFPPDVTFDIELPESNQGSFEPIYVFQDKYGRALPLNLRVVELICQAMFNQPPTRAQIREGLAEDLAYKDKVETADLEDGLEMSVLTNQLHQKEAIIVPEGVPND